MKAVIVYESMYGNTHLVAEAIGRGLTEAYEVEVVPAGHADVEQVAAADLVVVGGPTHVHGMSRPSTRQAAIADAEKPERELHVDPDAGGVGIREWLDRVDRLPARAAAFDTRLDAPAVLTGRASKGIARHLEDRGARLVAPPESFLVTKQNHLEPAEEEHARSWGERLARSPAVT